MKKEYMAYKRCNQCKKRMSDKCNTQFCSNKCETTYIESDVIFCKMCNIELGKESITKKRFCNNICANEHQRKLNQVERICINCDKSFIVQKSSHRYKLCSLECEKSYISSKERNNKRISTLSKNNLEKYGVKFTLSLPDIILKSRQTKLEKYGDERYNNIEKIKNTNFKKYGKKFILQLNEFVDKAKKTKLDRYGTLNFNDKSNKTKLDRYGTLNFSNISNKTKIDRYGTLNFSEKTKKTIKERYGSFSKLLMGKAYDRLKTKYENVVEFLFDKETYSGAQKYRHYSFKCKKCLSIFDDYMTNGFYPKCPICNPYIPSNQENEVYDFIKLIFTDEVLKNTRKILPSGKELDIYIPSKKLAIEYNGLFWHSENGGKKDKEYHINKTDECNELGIRLIHIFEDEWVNDKNIVESKLKHILNLNNEKIYARNCVVKFLDFITCSNFLENYHIQGNDKSSIRLGLYNNDELVGVMTFGKNRISLGTTSKENEYEMYRFCSSKTIVGGGSKLVSWFIKKYNPIKITSYADRRWSSDSAFYSKLGFNFIKNTTPNYWYFNKLKKRFHRFNFRKDQLSKKLQTFDPALTEWENMQLNGYDRIWDCGNLKYVWNNPNYTIK